MEKKKEILFVIMLIFYCQLPLSVTINIPDDYSTIQFGIDASANGDTILVADGLYFGFGNRELDFQGKAITVKSVNGSENTTIWCQFQGRGITFQNGEGLSSIFEGFTINEGDENYGGGIFCDNSSPTIRDVKIKNCKAGHTIYSGGGAIYLDSSHPEFSEVEIYNNISYHSGGGIFCVDSNPVLQKVLITNNTAYNDGGGIYFKSSNPVLTNVTIADNSANVGGGIFCLSDSHPVLENTILWNNSPQEISFSNSNTPCSITISYSDIMNGEAGIIPNNNAIINWLEGNISQNPLFEDSANNDYHLTWENFPIDDETKSPCINTGHPSSDFDPDNTVADIGAFYYPCHFLTNLDFIADKRFGYETLAVNFTSSSDYEIENYYWDFDNDGIIDSNAENPTYTFLQSGAYDVKLKVSTGTFIDSLIKPNYVVIQESELLPPENLNITINNNNAILSWTAIDSKKTYRENLYYLIYHSSFPDSDFEFIDYTIETTTYTHTDIAETVDKKFYLVIGFVGTLERLSNYIMNNKTITKLQTNKK
jgi:parallel beta-helix repeat protein